MIYVRLQGRIGNQLFMYAAAKNFQIERGKNEMILIDDTLVLEKEWKNSLTDYNLENVCYIHNKNDVPANYLLHRMCNKYYYSKIQGLDFANKYQAEKRKKKYFEKIGYIACENGYIDFGIPKAKNLMLNGYFQSEKYFAKYKDVILEEFNLDSDALLDAYPGIAELKDRNSVCISIKVEHTVGNKLYDVCSRQYWEKAIEYITQHVDNPLFFVCSDNVEYVKEKYIDCEKYDVICQDQASPVHISLAAMSKCKHFIIGNTSFGWWAQYLNQSDEKIVVVPSRWTGVDMPVDIYLDDFTTIDV